MAEKKPSLMEEFMSGRKKSSDLDIIRKRSVEVMENYPDQKSVLDKRLQDAREALVIAKDELDNAYDIEAYDKASEAVRRAELEIRFTEQAIDKIKTSPRMDEKEYFSYVDNCREIMNKASGAYREKVLSLMDQIKSAYDEYVSTAEEVNAVLVKLDESANVLQSKYPYRVIRRVNMPDEKIKDSSMWKKYALRYDNYERARIATEYTPGEVSRVTPLSNRDSVLVAIWKAINSGYPRKKF